MEVLALDVGAGRVGVARGSTQARLAEPLKTVKTTQAIIEIQNIINQTGAGLVVVGLPRNLSGDDTDQTLWVRAWVAAAQAKIKLPFYWQDEALTSQAAVSKRTKSKFDEHALAAAAILQDFFDTPKTDRKRAII